MRSRTDTLADLLPTASPGEQIDGIGQQERVAVVVDDEVFARLFAIQILLDEGFVVLEAGSSEEALDVIDRNDDASVLITDISMPGEMDGLALARRVADTYPHVAIIIVSGRVQPPSDQMPPGARFLPKPYSAHGLMSTVRSLGG